MTTYTTPSVPVVPIALKSSWEPDFGDVLLVDAFLSAQRDVDDFDEPDFPEVAHLATQPVEFLGSQWNEDEHGSVMGSISLYRWAEHLVAVEEDPQDLSVAVYGPGTPLRAVLAVCFEQIAALDEVAQSTEEFIPARPDVEWFAYADGVLRSFEADLTLF